MKNLVIDGVEYTPVVKTDYEPAIVVGERGLCSIVSCNF